jgi:hypothetical protein
VLREITPGRNPGWSGTNLVANFGQVRYFVNGLMINLKMAAAFLSETTVRSY